MLLSPQGERYFKGLLRAHALRLGSQGARQPTPASQAAFERAADPALATVFDTGDFQTMTSGGDSVLQCQPKPGRYK